MAWLGEDEEEPVAAAVRGPSKGVTGEEPGVPAAVVSATAYPAAGASMSTGGGAGEAGRSSVGGVPAVSSALDDEEGLDWLKEASILDDSVAGAAGDLSGLALAGDDDDVPDWLKD